MTEQEIQKLLEIQYLKGRIDELHKAIPTVTSLDRSRKLDIRLSKYYNKLKSVDEVAYHLYQVERENRMHSKRKDIEQIQDLLVDIYQTIDNDLLKVRIQAQLDRYSK